MTARVAERGGDLAAAELDADDLVLGYRIDISSDQHPFLSANWCIAEYRVNDRPIGDPQTVEEGQFNAMSATRVGDRLFTDELVLHWDGWSTAIPPVNFFDEPPSSRFPTTCPTTSPGNQQCGQGDFYW